MNPHLRVSPQVSRRDASAPPHDCGVRVPFRRHHPQVTSRSRRFHTVVHAPMLRAIRSPLCVKLLHSAHGHANGVKHGDGFSVTLAGLALEVLRIMPIWRPPAVHLKVDIAVALQRRSVQSPAGRLGDVEYCRNRCGAAEVSSRLR